MKIINGSTRYVTKPLSELKSGTMFLWNDTLFLTYRGVTGGHPVGGDIAVIRVDDGLRVDISSRTDVYPCESITYELQSM